MPAKQVSPKTAVVYCRTSTKGQRDAETIKAQVTRCRQFVEQHRVKLLPYGSKRDGWLKDDGISGSLLEGRAFAQLIDDLEHGRVQFDYLIVSNMSRLARPDKSSNDKAKRIKSQIDAARIFAVLGAYGVKIIDGEGINDPTSLVTEIKRSVSGDEYKGMRERTCAGKARVLDNGAWATGGRVPFGYKRVYINGRNKKSGTTLAACEVDGPRAKQLLAEWYVAGGAAHAARMAERAGWTAPRGGKSWYPSTIQQILKNLGAYLGEKTLTIDGQRFVVKYPPLFDLKTYAAIARRLRERTLPRRTTLLGTGFVDCGVCGGHIHGWRSSTRRYFHIACRGRCTRMREDVFAAKLWELVVARLIQIAEQERRIGNKDGYGPQIDAAKDKLKAVQERIERLVEAFAEGSVDKTALTKVHERLKVEKLAIQAEVDRLVREREVKAQKVIGEETMHGRVQAVLRRLRAERVSLDDKRKILADLLQGQRVILAKHANHATITLPAFGPLVASKVRLDREITAQVHGISRDGLEIIYDAVEGTTFGLGVGGETVVA